MRLATLESRHKMLNMLIFAPRGPVSVDDRDVLAVICGGHDGRFTYATVVTARTTISGAVDSDELARLEAELADPFLPAA